VAAPALSRAREQVFRSAGFYASAEGHVLAGHARGQTLDVAARHRRRRARV